LITTPVYATLITAVARFRHRQPFYLASLPYRHRLAAE
jgi:hypothetical protein